MIQEATGQPSSSATCAATAPMSSSMAWRPKSASPGASCLITAAIARAVIRVSAVSHTASLRCTARSAPMARQERSASLPRSGPSETATTSPCPRFSLIRSASSTANSS